MLPVRPVHSLRSESQRIVVRNVIGRVMGLVRPLRDWETRFSVREIHDGDEIHFDHPVDLVHWLVPDLTRNEVFDLAMMINGEMLSADNILLAIRLNLPRVVAPCGHAECLRDVDAARECRRRLGEVRAVMDV